MKTYNEFKEDMPTEAYSNPFETPELKAVDQARRDLMSALFKLTSQELRPVRDRAIKALGTFSQELNSAIFGTTKRELPVPANIRPLPPKGLPSNFGTSVTVGPWGTE